mgnify:FL=1
MCCYASIRTHRPQEGITFSEQVEMDPITSEMEEHYTTSVDTSHVEMGIYKARASKAIKAKVLTIHRAALLGP